MAVAVETDHLTKQFEKPRGWRRIARPVPVTAVNDVTLSVRRGELFGLLGPNGAGKTTLVKMLCTLILPTSGSATVAGYPLSESAAIRAAVGLVVSDERSFYWRLTAWENLRFFAAMYGLRGAAAERRMHEVLDAVDMRPFAHDRFSNFSTGMKQRIAIARGLLHQPRLLFLDEPSRSLDPTATAKLHDLLRERIQARQVTIFLITHDLVEAEKLCDRVAVMHKGRLQTIGQPAALRQQLKPQLAYTVRLEQAPTAVLQTLRSIVPDLQQAALPGRVELHFLAGETDGRLTAVLDQLRQHDLTIYSVQGEPPSLEEVFRHYTGEAPAPDGQPATAVPEGER